MMPFRNSKKQNIKQRALSARTLGSVNIDNYGHNNKPGRQQRETLKSKMERFLSGMENGEPRRSARTSSFWGFGSRSKLDTRESCGQLVDLKTLTEGKAEGIEKQLEPSGGGGGGADGAGGGGGSRSFTISAQETEVLLFIRPFVFNPVHIKRQCWDIIFVMLSLMYTAIRVPYAIAFDIDEFEQVDAWFVLNRLVDFIFISDMVIICMTAQKDGRKMITSHRRIAINYLKSWFLFDFCASVPLDLILFVGTGARMGTEEESDGDFSRSAKLIRVIKIFRTFRMLRMLRLKRVLITIEIFFGLNFNVMGIGKVCFFFVFVCIR